MLVDQHRTASLDNETSNCAGVRDDGNDAALSAAANRWAADTDESDRPIQDEVAIVLPAMNFDHVALVSRRKCIPDRGKRPFVADDERAR